MRAAYAGWVFAQVAGAFPLLGARWET